MRGTNVIPPKTNRLRSFLMENTPVSNETPMDSQSLKGTPAVAASDTQSSAARAVAGLENHTPMMQQYLRPI
ncbi:hypothetical protein [Burkholderia ubonensis]|uniref:hypothetical protein n=1 Tax=Burkholderia ubonensis TaxID=101571 RepID=UPI0012FB1E1E|nr:hypothetical protein [Burkholderia ubonensis]